MITGGSRGIGRAIADRYAEDRAHLILTYLQNEEAALLAKKELEQQGASSVEIQAVDVRNEDASRELVNAIRERYGHLDVLVNNAASGAFRALHELKLRHWNFTQDTCVKGPLWLSLQARPLLAKVKGSIVNISSLGSSKVIPNYGPIGVAKAALESLTRYMAVEMATDGIRVNAVSGGVVETTALDTYPDREQLFEKARTSTPAGRAVHPRDIAHAVYFLTSPAAEMIRGHVLIVDGGYSLT
ncbi:SDR family oxidoreductase [Alicyclobacillus tolerans]|uniref:SDR family oxidoreductase n=1 Tax=Alicyclobacillus tolerans TaxID=90970 RepID=UPI003B78344F